MNRYSAWRLPLSSILLLLHKTFYFIFLICNLFLKFGNHILCMITQVFNLFFKELTWEFAFMMVILWFWGSIYGLLDVCRLNFMYHCFNSTYSVLQTTLQFHFNFLNLFLQRLISVVITILTWVWFVKDCKRNHLFCLIDF